MTSLSTESKSRLSTAALAGLACLLSSITAHSADTDVFLSQTAVVPPNVMFALDNSWSMTKELLAPPDYDNSATYTGDFDSTHVYFSLDGYIPSSTDGLSHTSISNASTCDFGSLAIAVDGFVAVRAAIAFPSAAQLTQYIENFWYPAESVLFALPTDGHAFVECQDDSGIHGAATGDVTTYALETSGTLYTSDASKEVDWDDFPYTVMYSGNYLNYKANPGTYINRTRLSVQEQVVVDAIKRSPEIFSGLAVYDLSSRGKNANNRGTISRAAKDNSVRSNQLELLDSVQNMTEVRTTPLATTLLEVLHYYHGLAPIPGGDSTTITDSATLGTDGKYISPINFECQRNYVLFVTDGYPYGDNHAEDVFVSSSADYPEYSDILNRAVCEGSSCLDDIGQYLAEADAVALEDTTDLDGDIDPDPQTVKVYPVGMEIQQDLLDDTATAAGTESFYASNYDEFEAAIVAILANIKASQSVSAMTPSTSFNAFSKVSNSDFLYFGMFAPSNTFHWEGNLKKYRLAYETDTDSDPSNDVAYVTDQSTTDPDIVGSDGKLISSAHSYWSDSADGNITLDGGVLDRIKSQASRNIRGINNWDTGEQDIFVADNTISLNNTFFDAALGATDRSDADRTEIVNYALGQDTKDIDLDGNTTEQRGHIGAIMRSGPLAVPYGGTEANPIVILYVLTTDGLLHAFDEATGDELWAMMITDSYQHLADQYDNEGTLTPWWGIDGGITAKINDVNADGIISGTDEVLLYINTGMGLSKWIVIDVTNALDTADPAKILSRSEPPLNSDGTLNTGWDEFGLATSKIVPISYRLGTGATKDAFLYANGLDPNAEFSYGDSIMGRGLTIHEADTSTPSSFGDLIWEATVTSGSYSDMQYSFATTPTVIDEDGDGLIDLIYAIDLNAQIWRFFVNKGATVTSELFFGGILAKLGDDSDGNRRRAYTKLDAAIVGTGSSKMVVLAVGTGDKLNPLSTGVSDRLHIIKDSTAFDDARPVRVITASDLYDTTNINLDGSDPDNLTEYADMMAKDGWYVELPSLTGEKSISSPLIVSGVVYFPTYLPPEQGTDPCAVGDQGDGFLYRMDVLTGAASMDTNNDNSLSTADRSTMLGAAGVPGDIAVHTSSTGVRTALIGMEAFNTSEASHATGPLISDSYWFEESD